MRLPKASAFPTAYANLRSRCDGPRAPEHVLATRAAVCANHGGGRTWEPVQPFSVRCGDGDRGPGGAALAGSRWRRTGASRERCRVITNDPIAVSVTPWLSVRNGARAVEFYKSAFGAREVYRIEDPGGAVVSRLADRMIGPIGRSGIARSGDRAIRERIGDCANGVPCGPGSR